MKKNDLFMEKLEEGKAQIDNFDSEYQERLDYEVGIIREKGFEDYFLILEELVRWSKENGILVGPGRGSSAGSLVAYLLGITLIDPLKYDLIFERFLNPSRPDLPDIDVDFQKSRRLEVFKHVRDTYGEDRTCFISTFSTFHVKQLLRDLCRIYDVPIETSNRLSKIVPGNVETLEEAEGIKEVKDFLEKHPEIHELAGQMEGAIRQKSVHAAGMVITPAPITEYLSIEKVKGEHCSCFDMYAIDHLGLLKIDILSLKTLDVIARALELSSLDYTQLPLEFTDPKVYEIFKKGFTLGVFQFESSLLTGLSKKLQIADFQTLYAATTIARPGPLHSKETDKYIKRHLGEQKVKYLDPVMESITEETYGLMLFQEQTMQLAIKAANFTQVESEILRKIIGKSKGKEAIDEYKDKFLDGCGRNKIPRDTAGEMWDVMRESSKYGFNKSHAVAYSAVSYWCAWLKAYHPKEFLVALMEFESDDIQGNATRELREMDYMVLAPDINRSKGSVYIADDGEIYMGLSDVEGVGEKAVEEILEHQPYSSFDDFMGRVQKRRANSRVVRNLIQSGAFDTFGRRDSLFYTLDDDEYHEWDDEEMLRRQMMVLDIPSSTPLINYYDNPYERYLNITPIKDIEFSEKIDEIWAKGIVLDFSPKKSANTRLEEFFGEAQTMAYFDLDDGTKKVQCFIAPEQLSLYSARIKEGNPVLIKSHTFGKKEKLYIDGVIDLGHPTPEGTLEKYIRNGRIDEVEALPIGDYRVNVIVYAIYQTSKKGKNYVRIKFDDGTEGLCFQFDSTIFRSGEILLWTSNKSPFVNIVRRIA